MMCCAGTVHPVSPYTAHITQEPATAHDIAIYLAWKLVFPLLPTINPAAPVYLRHPCCTVNKAIERANAL